MANPPAPADKSTSGKDKLHVAVRQMELDDLPVVYRLGERLFTADDSPNLYRTWDVYELVDTFSSETEYCFVAEHGEQIVGFVMGTIIQKRKSAWTYGYLVWLGVDPALEGRGIARRLVGRLTEVLIEDGARIMMVDTEADNDRALELFERLGFGNPVEHVYLTRNLTGLEEYRRQRDLERDAEEWERAWDRDRLRRRRPTRRGGKDAAQTMTGTEDSNPSPGGGDGKEEG